MYLNYVPEPYFRFGGQGPTQYGMSTEEYYRIQDEQIAAQTAAEN